MITKFDMKKIVGGEAKHNPMDFTWTSMHIKMDKIYREYISRMWLFIYMGLSKFLVKGTH